MEDRKQSPGFRLYNEFSLPLLSLPDDEVGTLIKAAINYKLHHVVDPELKGAPAFAFIQLRATIDRDELNYTETCAQNAANRAKANKKRTENDDS